MPCNLCVHVPVVRRMAQDISSRTGGLLSGGKQDTVEALLEVGR